MNKRTNRARQSSTSTSLWGLAPLAILVVGLGYMSAATPTAPLGDKDRAPQAPGMTANAVTPSAPVLLAQTTPRSTEAFNRPSEPAAETSAGVKKDDSRGEAPPGPAEFAVIDLTGMAAPRRVPGNELGGDPFSAAQGLVFEKEPNDTAAQATSLGGTNVVAKGNIYKLSNGPAAATGDIDTWSFSGTAGDRVYAATMTSWAPSSSTDTTLELVGTDGTTILETDLDDGSLGSSSSTIAGTTLPATGTFYLRVRQSSNSSRIAPYFLHFRLQNGSPTPETEANDTPATANPLPANGWVSGTHGATTDTDWFYFSANAGDTIYLSLDADPERDNVQWNPRIGVGLFGDAGNQILVVDDASTGTAANPLSEAVFMTVKVAGTYYAYIDTTLQTTGGPTQTYNLSVAVHPATPIGTNCTVYTSTDVPKTIGPAIGTTTNSTIVVPGNPRIEDLDVSITLNHTIMADIDAALISPAGNENSIFTDIGASAAAGQAQMDLDIDDEAGIPPLFTVLKGEGFLPEAAYRLNWLKGELAGGTWTLRLRDDANATNGGNLTAWSITICEPPAPAACAGTTVTLLATDFEANNGGFTPSAVTTAPWQWGTPTVAPIATCNSGVNCWKTNLTGLYSASANQDLVSPTMNLSGLGAPITLSWAQKYQLESASFDTFWLDVREVGPTNATNLFQHLDATMTDTVGSTPSTTLQETAGWGLVTRDISAYANKSAVQLRWGFVSDTSGQFAGAAIDDVTVTACCTAASCNDNNSCTDDVCDAVLGCVHTNNDANACSDGNACTGPDFCSAGACVPGPNPCNDNDACTVDVCDGAGGCTYSAVSCDDSNACTDDTCIPATGCAHANNTIECSDNNACTIGDACAGGVCVPGAGALPASVQFCNTSGITIPTLGTATPYPSVVTVAGQPSVLCSVTVNLTGLTHTYPSDVDFLLARGAPALTTPNALILSDAGGSTGITGINLTLDDLAASSVVTPIVSGTFKPTNIGTGDTMPLPAPAPSGGSALSAFVGGNPNGTWNLWVNDQFTPDGGSLFTWCVNVISACSSSAGCDDGNVCTDDTCVNGTCAHANNTVACNDSNACTTGDTCTGGLCVGGPPPSCDDGDVCTADSCNTGTGLCENHPVVCNDNNSCTDDVCVGPTTGCTYTANDANPCTDNNACTQTDSCNNGTCVGSNPVVCPDDGNVCTTETCVPATGLCVSSNNTNLCDDGNVCTVGDQCAQAGFNENFDLETAPALPAGWASTTTGSGAAWVTQSTSFDTPPNSAFGFDGPGPLVADEVFDSPPIPIVSATATLTFRNRWSFESATTCFDGGVLEIKIGAGSFTDIVTAGGSFGTGGYTGIVSTAFSNPLAGKTAWCLASAGYPGYLTTTVNLPAAAAGQTIQLRWRVGTDTSVGAAGQNIDSIVISDVSTCQPGAPAPAATACGDPSSSACDGADHCTGTDGSCDPNYASTTTTCGDAEGQCTNQDYCDGTGACTDNGFKPSATPCSDGSACTTADACDGAGFCVGGPAPNCDDSNPCTVDSCDPGTGCVNDAPAANGFACGDPSDTGCDNPDSCLDGTCAPNYEASGLACSDGSACTTADACDGAGLCVGGPALNCDDGNPCTVDACDPGTGCVHDAAAANGFACGDPSDTDCDNPDTCLAGVCVINHEPDGSPCSDGNACTNDVCSGGACGCPVTSGACQGSLTNYDSTDVPKTIPTTVASVTSTLTISGAGSYLYDLDVKTFITHTSNGQLQISIKSPAGTIVTLTSNNGGTNDNVFNGTVWNDKADPASQVPYTNALNLATDTLYANLVVKPTLAPEEPLGAFIGENPNGVWTLTIADQTAADGGNLANWSMALTTLPAAPAASTTSYPSTDVPKTIPTTAPPVVVASSVLVSGAGTQIGRVRLTDFILHTFASDLDITIKSPAGTIVTLTTDNGAGNDNVFNGTLWDDKADPGNQVPYVVPLAASNLATDAVYANLVVKPTLTAEEGLAAFIGEDPNGVWTLTISDDANLDGGTLSGWTLEITTTTCVVSNCAVICNDNNPCTDDSCDPGTGCFYTSNTASCNDGVACTTGDVCSGGSCAGTPTICNDGNTCTDDSCNPATGQCVYANNTNTCDDGNTCTTGDHCSAPPVCGSTENFDGVTAPALPSGWTSTVTGTGNLWTTVSTSSDTPPNSAFGFDGAVVADEVLVSPPIPILSSSATLTFRNRWTFEGTTTCFDGGVLEIKIGAGSFTDIVTAGGSFVSGGYTNTVSSSFSNPLAGRLAWCIASTGYPAYLTTVVNLPAAAAGQTIQLRWRVGTDTSVGAAGQNIDSIAIADSCAAACTGGAALDCNDNNPCTADSCDPATGCVHTANTGQACGDPSTGACDAPDTCDASGVCQPNHSSTSTTCGDAEGPCTNQDYCDGNGGCTDNGFKPAATACGDPSTGPCDGADHCTGVDGSCDPNHAATSTTCGDAEGPCTNQDYCDGNGGCADNGFKPAATACGDPTSGPCDSADHCTGINGSCDPNHAATSTTCGDAEGPCTNQDYCDGNGDCADNGFKPAATACGDPTSGPCDGPDHCTGINGSCDPNHASTSTTCGDAGTQCTNQDYCSGTGTCTDNGHQPNGTVCDDASLCTTGETCQAGTCTPAFNGLNHPAPKSSGYYHQLCEKWEHNQLPYHGDTLTDADAVCVGQLTATFSGISTVADICAIIDSDARPPHGGRHHGGPGNGPDGKDCDKGEDELVATALNICRARVCEEQNLDSRCRGNNHTTVSQSFSDADAILDDAARTRDTCKDARCELREINNGKALEMNSLVLSMDNNKVRLTWLEPVLDDGNGHADSYDLYRRPMGSAAAFTKIGTTTGLTFLDTTSGTAMWEYEITANVH